MKKLIKSIALIFTTLCLLGCADAGKSPEELNNEKPIVLEDGTIVISNKVDDAILGYNEWGTGLYSLYQSETFDITDLFEGNLPKTGDTVKFYWKGKSNRDVKNLYLLVANIDEGGWTHLLLETKRATPIKTDIKAGEDFEIKGSVTLDFDSKKNVSVLLCCGAEDTDGPVHLYSTAEENTSKYDEYTCEIPHSDTLKVISKGKMEVDKENKKYSFKTLPVIQLTNGTKLDANTADGKKELLEKGAFALWARSNTENLWDFIGKDDGHIPGNWGNKNDDFNEHDYSWMGEYPIYVDCLYFELIDPAKEPDEKETNHYCPVLAFDILVINE